MLCVYLPRCIKYSTVGIMCSVLNVRRYNVPKVAYLTILGVCKGIVRKGPYLTYMDSALLYPYYEYFRLLLTLYLR